jgi:hypothetical protein
MVIAVGAMSVAATATHFITGNLRENMSERLIIEDVWFKDGEIAIYLRNIGKTSLRISAVYVNQTPQPFIPPDFSLEMSQHSWLNVTYSWSLGSTYHISAISSRGTEFADYYKTPSY